MNIEEVQNAIDTLADGDELRKMTRHNAADFVQATVVVVETAKLVAAAPTRRAFRRRVEHVEDGKSSVSIPAWITEVGHDRPFVIIEMEEK
jgi:hypothetical protein